MTGWLFRSAGGTWGAFAARTWFAARREAARTLGLAEQDVESGGVGMVLDGTPLWSEVLSTLRGQTAPQSRQDGPGRDGGPTTPPSAPKLNRTRARCAAARSKGNEP